MTKEQISLGPEKVFFTWRIAASTLFILYKYHANTWTLVS